MATTLKLAYCAKCSPVVGLAVAPDFKAPPRHFDPKSRSMHDATIVDIDPAEIRPTEEAPAQYFARMIAKYVTK